MTREQIDTAIAYARKNANDPQDSGAHGRAINAICDILTWLVEETTATGDINQAVAEAVSSETKPRDPTGG